MPPAGRVCSPEGAAPSGLNHHHHEAEGAIKKRVTLQVNAPSPPKNMSMSRKRQTSTIFHYFSILPPNDSTVPRPLLLTIVLRVAVLQSVTL